MNLDLRKAFRAAKDVLQISPFRKERAIVGPMTGIELSRPQFAQITDKGTPVHQMEPMSFDQDHCLPFCVILDAYYKAGVIFDMEDDRFQAALMNNVMASVIKRGGRDGFPAPYLQSKDVQQELEMLRPKYPQAVAEFIKNSGGTPAPLAAPARVA